MSIASYPGMRRVKKGYYRLHVDYKPMKTRTQRFVELLSRTAVYRIGINKKYQIQYKGSDIERLHRRGLVKLVREGGVYPTCRQTRVEITPAGIEYLRKNGVNYDELIAID